MFVKRETASLKKIMKNVYYYQQRTFLETSDGKR